MFDNNEQTTTQNNYLIPTSQWGEDIVLEEELVRKNFLKIQEKIAHYKTKIIAVTKYFGMSAIELGYKVGLRDFAESRAQEAVEKIQRLPDDIRENSTFHFIGHLQTNKVAKVVRFFDVIQSVDSLKLAKSISEVACQLNKREKIFLQVNMSGEEQKFGYSKTDLFNDIQEISKLSGLEILGLMSMAPLDASDEELHRLFGSVKALAEEIKSIFGINLDELSMGMSNDYQIAIQEGATMIRVGRKLFK